MKFALIFIVAVALLICFYFVFLAATAKVPETGLLDGKLRPCPDKPNCVNSESMEGKSDGHDIEPIALADPEKLSAIWAELPQIIEASGGAVQQHDEGYLWAEYTSTVFRFVDDLEIRMDLENQQLQVRSASRSGTSDLGVNRKRVETLRLMIEQRSAQ